MTKTNKRTYDRLASIVDRLYWAGSISTDEYWSTLDELFIWLSSPCPKIAKKTEIA